MNEEIQKKCLCTPEKKRLIEEVGLHFQEGHNLSPLAGRIFALLVLSKKKGFSFEQMVEITGASKSSVSTNINLLVQMKFVEYYTKPGDRKRFFRMTKNNLRVSLEEKLADLEKELLIVEKINNFNCENNPQKFEKEENIGFLLQNHLKAQKKNLKATINKLHIAETKQNSH